MIRCLHYSPEQLSDLSKYSSELVDGGVIAYPVEHSRAGATPRQREIEFKIKAQVLKLKEGQQAEDAAEKTEKTEGDNKEEL